MAVEEVSSSLSKLQLYSQQAQEFTIEIPDAEADEIKTVQQGQFFTLGVRSRL